ncbi:MAG: hypothetical protein OSB26_08450 [Woeseiaceae bacterium]|jgi:hypothetical protein|nr:hypothetical protein [Woeseiaceae bacterium]|tara:strand:- start:176 stop:325 length:150 start_codon:yes stop_codon:yes gene_type:complete
MSETENPVRLYSGLLNELLAGYQYKKSLRETEALVEKITSNPSAKKTTH